MRSFALDWKQSFRHAMELYYFQSVITIFVIVVVIMENNNGDKTGHPY
jgi:hypothetical protein